MNKIKSRKICDDVVKKRVNEEPKLRVYLDNVDMYKGNVITTLPRVKLEKYKAEVPGCKIIDSFNKTYNAVKATRTDDSDGYILFVDADGKTERAFDADNEEINVLRALTINQASQSLIYSDAVSTVFRRVFQSIITGTHIRSWNFEESDNLAFNAIYKAIAERVDEILEG